MTGDSGPLTVVVGTGTEVGKTWVSAQLLVALRAHGAEVAVRKPAQSFTPAETEMETDAAVLGYASGESPERVCPLHRWYPVPLAPPMAAAALGMAAFGIADLVDEMDWPERSGVIRLVETAGGIRSPQADDGDARDLLALIRPDHVLLVADAGLGTIHAVRCGVEVLRDVARPLIVLNRFDPASDLHARNLEWLRVRDGLDVWVTPGDEAVLAQIIGSRSESSARRDPGSALAIPPG
jgi:dethiobiotin synthetase